MNLLKPTLETFVCCDCGTTYAIGMDVEKDIYLGASDVDTRCVFCYNKLHSRPLNILLCQQQAAYYARHGVCYTFLEKEKGISILD